MPSKKKKYNARFPAGRIKKIMQTDEEVGKVAQAVPVIISRTLELFVESLLKKAGEVTTAKNAKTLTPSHLKQCILSESRFDFLKDLVKNIPDVSSAEDEAGPSTGAAAVAGTSTTKSTSSYNRFHLRRKSDGAVPKPSATITSQASSISQPALPKFYNEIEIGGDDSKQEEEEEPEIIILSEKKSCRTPVIQHTGPKVNHKPPEIPSFNEYIKSHTPGNSMGEGSSSAGNSSGTEKTSYILTGKRKLSTDEDEDDDDDDYEENGYHRLEIVTKPCVVDEDYDA